MKPFLVSLSVAGPFLGYRCFLAGDRYLPTHMDPCTQANISHTHRHHTGTHTGTHFYQPEGIKLLYLGYISTKSQASYL